MDENFVLLGTHWDINLSFYRTQRLITVYTRAWNRTIFSAQSQLLLYKRVVFKAVIWTNVWHLIHSSFLQKIFCRLMCLERVVPHGRSLWRCPNERQDKCGSQGVDRVQSEPVHHTDTLGTGRPGFGSGQRQWECLYSPEICTERLWRLMWGTARLCLHECPPYNGLETIACLRGTDFYQKEICCKTAKSWLSTLTDYNRGWVTWNLFLEQTQRIPLNYLYSETSQEAGQRWSR